MGAPWLIRLPADPDGRVAWKGPGVAPWRHDPLVRVAERITGEAVAVVPGMDILLTRVTLPRTDRRKWERALPYLLEESLSVPVESLHFAMGRSAPDGTLPVAVVSRRRMEAWLTELRNVGVRPVALWPETLLLPWEPALWTVVATAESAMVRTGAHSGFAVDRRNLPLALRLALAQAGPMLPTRIRLLDPLLSVLWPDEAIPGIPLQVETPRGDFLSSLARHDAPACGIDLLQGEFAPAGRWTTLWGTLRLPLLVMACWLLLRGGAFLVDGMGLEARNAELQQEMHHLFRQTFPEVQRIVDPRIQMAQQWEALRRSGAREGGERGFLRLFARVADPLRREEPTALRGVRFQDGELELLLRLADLQRLDGLQRALQASGLAVTVQSAAREGEGISARLKVGTP